MLIRDSCFTILTENHTKIKCILCSAYAYSGSLTEKECQAEIMLYESMNQYGVEAAFFTQYFMWHVLERLRSKIFHSTYKAWT